MKRISIIATIALLATLWSCEKEIPLDLDGVAKKPVIVSSLKAGESLFEVSITQTTDYFTPVAQDPITNASVRLIEQDGTVHVVPHVTGDRYEATGVNAVANQRYTLEVVIEGEEYRSTTFLPLGVNIDAVDAADPEYGFFYFDDPVGAGNYYYYVYGVNDSIFNNYGFFYYSDQWGDGGTIEGEFFLEQVDYQSGDSLILLLRTIDKPVYDYYVSLEQAQSSGDGGPFAPAPSNPINNWSNGALGYFEATSETSAKAVLP